MEQPVMNHRPQVPAKVMVVDDIAANRALAKAILDDEGYAVILAASGPEALALFPQERPDCVLLDVRMPGLDGFAVCEQIRALPEGMDTPVIFLTASRDVETFDRALLVGGDDFLTKPVHPVELAIRVQAALRLRVMGSERRELYSELRRQRDATIRLQLQKEQVMTFLVADLKSPVGVMALHAQTILHDPSISEDTHEAASQIQATARQLLRLVLNLLDISKGEEGLLDPVRVPTELTVLVHDVVAALTAQAEAAGVTLRASGEAPPVTVDPNLIRRTLANLLDNAIRYTPVGAEVQVRLSSDDAAVLLTVADAGPGVPPARRDEIFDRFAPQTADEVTSIGRTGLGLAFCKLAVEAHGGRIWVEDGAPGAIMCVRLPLG